MKKFLIFIVLAIALLAGYLVYLGAKPEDLLHQPLTVFNELILKKIGFGRPLVVTEQQATPAPKPAQESQPPLPQQTPAATPNVNAELAQLSQSRAEWPKTVVLKKQVEFPAVLDGKVVGSVKAPPNTQVQLILVKADKVGVEYHGGGAMVDAPDTDLIEQVTAARHTAPANHAVAVASPPAQPQNIAPVGTQSSSPPPPAEQSPLDKFVATVGKNAPTLAPPFSLFFDMTSRENTARFASGSENSLSQLETEKKLAITRYNAFVAREFPDKPAMKLEFFDSRIINATIKTADIDISPAKILWLAADESSEDTKYILKWMKWLKNAPDPVAINDVVPQTGPNPVGVIQTAMQTLDKELSDREQDASTVRILKYLHDAQAALQSLLDARNPSVDDQRKIVFFLKASGISK